MTIGLIFTLLLVALNKKIACVEKGLEIGGCTLRETREGLGTWPSPPALGKCAEEDKYIYIYIVQAITFLDVDPDAAVL